MEATEGLPLFVVGSAGGCGALTPFRVRKCRDRWGLPLFVVGGAGGLPRFVVEARGSRGGAGGLPRFVVGRGPRWGCGSRGMFTTFCGRKCGVIGPTAFRGAEGRPRAYHVTWYRVGATVPWGRRGMGGRKVYHILWCRILRRSRGGSPRHWVKPWPRSYRLAAGWGMGVRVYCVGLTAFGGLVGCSGVRTKV